MAVVANIRMALDVFEDITGLLKSAALPYGVDALNIQLGAGTTPAVDTVYGGLFALSAGALTVDLTALTRSGRSNLSLTGKTIYAVRIKNLGANPMTFKDGVTNGYALFTATNGHVVRANGDTLQYAPAGFGAVGASDLAIDVSGTGTQTFYMVLAAGTAA